jgi:DnaJ family protein C protein 8
MAQEEEILKRLDEIKQEVAKEKKLKKEEEELTSFFDEVKEKKDIEESNKVNEDDLLAGFFSEVLKPKEEEKKVKEIDNIKDNKNLKAEETKDEKALTAKYMNAELGTGPEQVDRILSSNYKWKNLNPYYVLQLDIDATEEDIKYRYKKLSAKVHPDKLIGIDNAREAFEEVKDAYNKLLDESQKKVIMLNIENVRSEVTEERRKLKLKGTKEDTLPNLEDEISKKTMKAFADIEMAKRRSENNARSYNAREKSQVAEQQEKLKAESKHEEEWNDIDRREKRVGNWRDFAKTDKKAKISTYNVEQRDFQTHGKVFLDGKSHKL